jgi:hypothetical protein
MNLHDVHLYNNNKKIVNVSELRNLSLLDYLHILTTRDHHQCSCRHYFRWNLHCFLYYWLFLSFCGPTWLT